MIALWLGSAALGATWQLTSGPHIDVYAPSDEAERAASLLATLEPAWLTMSRELDFYLTERVVVVLDPRVDAWPFRVDPDHATVVLGRVDRLASWRASSTEEAAVLGVAEVLARQSTRRTSVSVAGGIGLELAAVDVAAVDAELVAPVASSPWVVGLAGYLAEAAGARAWTSDRASLALAGLSERRPDPETAALRAELAFRAAALAGGPGAVAAIARDARGRVLGLRGVMRGSVADLPPLHATVASAGASAGTLAPGMTDVALTVDGTWVAGWGDGVVRVRRTAAERWMPALKGDVAAWCASDDDGGAWLVAVDRGQLRARSVDAAGRLGRRVGALGGWLGLEQSDRITAASCAPDGRTLAFGWTARDRHGVRFLQIDPGRARNWAVGPRGVVDLPGPVDAIAWSPGGGRLLAAITESGRSRVLALDPTGDAEAAPVDLLEGATDPAWALDGTIWARTPSGPVALDPLRGLYGVRGIAGDGPLLAAAGQLMSVELRSLGPELVLWPELAVVEPIQPVGPPTFEHLAPAESGSFPRGPLAVSAGRPPVAVSHHVALRVEEGARSWVTPMAAYRADWLRPGGPVASAVELQVGEDQRGSAVVVISSGDWSTRGRVAAAREVDVDAPAREATVHAGQAGIAVMRGDASLEVGPVLGAWAGAVYTDGYTSAYRSLRAGCRAAGRPELVPDEFSVDVSLEVGAAVDAPLMGYENGVAWQPWFFVETAGRTALHPKSGVIANLTWNAALRPGAPELAVPRLGGLGAGAVAAPWVALPSPLVAEGAVRGGAAASGTLELGWARQVGVVLRYHALASAPSQALIHGPGAAVRTEAGPVVAELWVTRPLSSELPVSGAGWWDLVGPSSHVAGTVRLGLSLEVRR